MDNSIRFLYQKVVQTLNVSEVEDYDTVALFIIEEVFSRKYLSLISESIEFTEDDYKRVMDIVDQYLAGMPLAYIFKKATFRNNQYFISEGVLIPRPETEEMVDYLITIINKLLIYDNSLLIGELGVGSGVISLELAQEFPSVSFYGSDISQVAVNITQRNMTQFNVTNLQLVHGDFFQTIDSFLNNTLNLLISNPPYISHEEYLSLDPYVLKEPKEALVADNDGLEVIFKSLNFCIAQSIIYIAEIGFSQHEKISKSFPDESIFFLKDYSGYHRFIIYVPKLFKWHDDFIKFLIHLNK